MSGYGDRRSAAATAPLSALLKRPRPSSDSDFSSLDRLKGKLTGSDAAIPTSARDRMDATISNIRTLLNPEAKRPTSANDLPPLEMPLRPSERLGRLLGDRPPLEAPATSRLPMKLSVDVRPSEALAAKLGGGGSNRSNLQEEPENRFSNSLSARLGNLKEMIRSRRDEDSHGAEDRGSYTSSVRDRLSSSRADFSPPRGSDAASSSWEGKGRSKGKGGKRGRKGSGRDVDGPRRDREDEDLPPLDPELLEEILRFLEENGGQLEGGVIGNIFRVKKVQLKPHFDMVEVGRGKYWVRLQGLDAPVPESPPRPKRRRLEGEDGIDGDDEVGEADQDMDADAADDGFEDGFFMKSLSEGMNHDGEDNQSQGQAMEEPEPEWPDTEDEYSDDSEETRDIRAEVRELQRELKKVIAKKRRRDAMRRIGLKSTR